MTSEQVEQETRPAAEIGVPQTRYGLRDVEQPAARGQIDDTERADHDGAHGARRCNAGPIVHQNQRCCSRPRKDDGLTFAVAETVQGRIRVGAIGMN